ncbi:MAG: hypothetical protein OXN89_09305 [Bryobacterales bacterium]|nr:hypothetical protein [Bryobacterales bacterium]
MSTLGRRTPIPPPDRATKPEVAQQMIRESLFASDASLEPSPGASVLSVLERFQAGDLQFGASYSAHAPLSPWMGRGGH